MNRIQLDMEGQAIYSTPPFLENLVSKEKSKLDGCKKEFVYLGYNLHLKNGSHHQGVAWGLNYCRSRACPKCVPQRIGEAKDNLTPYFDRMPKVRHVVLTFGKHRMLTKENKDECIRLFNNWVRGYNRPIKEGRSKRVDSRDRMPLNGVYVFEAKPKARGLYHLHLHVAIADYVPHHMKVIKTWAKTLGKHADVKVVYNVKKEVIKNYFARRIAMAGVGIPLNHYVTAYKGTRLFGAFSVHKDYFNLEVSETILPSLVLKHLNISEDDVDFGFVWYLGTTFVGGLVEPPPDALMFSYWEKEEY